MNPCDRPTARQLPTQQRALIEAVYGEGACYPVALQVASDSAEGSALGEGMMAEQNTISIEDGYRRTRNSWPDDFRAQTRLGEPTVEVALARVLNGVIVPWAQGNDDYECWNLSVVRVRAAQLSERANLVDAELEAQAKTMQTELPFLRWRILLVLILDERGLVGTAKAKNSVLREFSYDESCGLKQIRF